MSGQSPRTSRRYTSSSPTLVASSAPASINSTLTPHGCTNTTCTTPVNTRPTDTLLRRRTSSHSHKRTRGTAFVTASQKLLSSSLPQHLASPAAATIVATTTPHPLSRSKTYSHIQQIERRESHHLLHPEQQTVDRTLSPLRPAHPPKMPSAPVIPLVSAASPPLGGVGGQDVQWSTVMMMGSAGPTPMIEIEDDDLTFGGKPLSTWYEEDRRRLSLGDDSLSEDGGGSSSRSTSYRSEEMEEERRGRQRVRPSYKHENKSRQHHHHGNAGGANHKSA